MTTDVKKKCIERKKAEKHNKNKNKKKIITGGVCDTSLQRFHKKNDNEKRNYREKKRPIHAFVA
jgi:hypothetical protein